MDFNNNSLNNNKWESGVKFVEERKPKKFMRFLGMILLMFFAASIGGILGGYYVKKNYAPDSLTQARSFGETNEKADSSNAQSSPIPKNAVTKVAETVGPAVVGVENNVFSFEGLTPQGSGSGIIFDKQGYIVTNEHVIEGANKITVTLPGGERKVNATLVGADKKTDLAVLKIDVGNLPVAKFGDSSKVRVGDLAIAIGNPLGQEYAGTVTVGFISAVNRNINMDGRKYKVFQTDASINPGNSGGALCNEAGEVIGINSLKAKQSEGMSFAISINEAKPIIQSLMKDHYISRPYLGIYYVFIDQETAKYNDIPVGVAIQQVVTGSAAEKAGIRQGDIITSFDGVEIKEQNDIGDILEKHKVGDSVTAKLWRNGRILDVTVKLQDSKGQ